VVAHRDAPTLERIISNHVLSGSGTTVIMDAWQGYQNVAQLNNRVYSHTIIVHTHEFIDSDDPYVHTETIEELRMQAK